MFFFLWTGLSGLLYNIKAYKEQLRRKHTEKLNWSVHSLINEGWQALDGQMRWPSSSASTLHDALDPEIFVFEGEGYCYRKHHKSSRTKTVGSIQNALERLTRESRDVHCVDQKAACISYVRTCVHHQCNCSQYTHLTMRDTRRFISYSQSFNRFTRSRSQHEHAHA